MRYLEEENGGEYCLNLSGLNRLKTLQCDSLYNFCGLENLEELYVDYWQEKDLSKINGVVLKKLRIMKGSLTSLSGSDSIVSLKSLSVANNRKLTDFSMLKYMKELIYLEIDCCPKMQDTSLLTGLSRLEVLKLFGNNKIGNINFISGLNDLRVAMIEYYIEDGDISKLLRLDYATVFVDRKHYNIKDKNLPKNLTREIKI